MVQSIFRLLVLGAFFSSKILALILPSGPETVEDQIQLPGPGTAAPQGAFLIQNQGQFSPGARYFSPAGASNLWLAEDHLWITFFGDSSDKGAEVAGLRTLPDKFHGSAIRLGFGGSNPDPVLVPFNPLETRVSYIKGATPDSWTTDLPTWGGVRYLDLYPGIDLVILASGSGPQWYFEVREGGNPVDVQLVLEGVQEVTSQDRELKLVTSSGQVNLPLFSLVSAFSTPESVSTTTGPTEVAVQPMGNGVFSIENPFVDDLDPVGLAADQGDLVYSTYLGGGDWETAYGVDLDSSGAAYVTGRTPSTDFPTTPGAYDVTPEGVDIFIAKLNPLGTGLEYATYLGGSGQDTAYGIAVENGVAYIAGDTWSLDFPLVGEPEGENDVVVAALNTTGTDLIYATLIGGSYQDYGNAIGVEGGLVYASGTTLSRDFPASGYSAYEDAFVLKLNTDGTLNDAVMIGGRDVDAAYGIEVQGGGVYITGATWSIDFPAPGFMGNGDMFIAKYDSSLSRLYAQRMGGIGEERGFDLAIHGNGQIYVAGFTTSPFLPNASGTLSGSQDALLTVYNTDGALVHNYYLGGTDTEEGRGVALDSLGGVYLGGNTGSADFPVTADAFQAGLGGQNDAFVVRVDLEDVDLIQYATYLGGTQTDQAYSMAFDQAYNVYLTGSTRSSDFPTSSGAFSTVISGTQDAFVSKISVRPAPGIQIEKHTNEEDADLSPGLILLSGSAVDWTYTVTNSGYVTLTNVQVSDDQGLTVSCPTTTLVVGEQMTCSAPTGNAIEGQYSNLGMVTADTPYSTTISDVDPSHYFGAVPETTIVKLTNSADANTAPGIFIEESSAITWTYEITNSGNVDLTDVSVIDNNGTPDNPDDDVTVCTIPLLQAGEADTSTCLMTGTAQPGQYGNYAVVTGNPPGGLDSVSDGDSSYYFGSAPAIDLVKKINGFQVTAAPGPYLLVNDPITWTYEITNSGNVTLTNVTVVDDNGTPEDPGDDHTVCSGLELAPLAAHTCTLGDTAQVGAYHNVATVTGTPPVGSLTPVQDSSFYFGAEPVIELEYSVNGDPADTAPGLYLLADSSLALEYQVSNTGNVTLTNLVVTDDLGVIISCPQSTLAPAESMTCSASSTALVGQNSATANVTASPPSPLADVSAEDPIYYFGATPGLALDKRTNGQDANTAPGVYVLTGSTVEWTYTVTNTGNVTLTSVTVVDDNGTPANPSDDLVPPGCDAISLAPDQAATCTASGIAQEGDYANIAAASGSPPAPLTALTASDTSHYYGATLNISLDKRTNGLEAAEVPGPLIAVGEPVNWTYSVTNSSNVTVTFEIEDDPSVEVSCPGYSLSPDEVVLCTASGIAEAGQYTNTVTVTSTPPGGLAPVITQDTSHYFGVITGVDLEKSTNGQDADSPTGPLIKVGELVNWRYVVENTGNVNLTGVSVTDDQGVTVSCPGDSLDPGESMICTASGEALEGQYTNTGTVIADPPLGFDQVSDSDLSHYFGSTIGVDLQKFTNGVDATEAPGPYILVGGAVNWTYVITNVGNITVENIILTDDQIGVIENCPTTTLGPGASISCSASGLAVPGQYSNVGIVSASPQGLAGLAQDTDTSYYFGAEPAIQIVKKTNGYDANEPPGPYIPVGETVITTYELSNNEVDYYFTDIAVTDESGFVPNCPKTYLNPGRSMTCTASGTAAEGQQADTAQVTANAWLDDKVPVNLGQISAQDINYYFGYALDLDLVKYTNGIDVPAPPGPELAIGFEVVWTYEVSNNSNVPISNVTVWDDDAGVDVVCPLTDLESGEQMTCSASGEVVEGQYSNTGEAMAQFNADPLAAADVSYYFGIPPLLVHLPLVIR